MNVLVLRRALGATIACAATLALAPAVAGASTWTVDDDRLQCPTAGFTTIQAAVDQAAPWDTVVVCDGTYRESSIPASTTVSPSQTGSRNGLTITKPLTIRGAGADKVTIMPAAGLAPSLAGTAPYLRDGGGNVITVSRQSAGATADNENRVDISGVTVSSPDVYAEAGISYFNTSGTIENSVVGPLRRAADATELAARPHGWGVVMTNHLQGAEAGVQRTVTIKGSLVSGYGSGGVLFDDSRGTDGNPTTLQRSGIKAYGTIVDSRIQGSGPDAVTPQTGVRWHAGQRGSITKSVVTGNLFTPDQRRSVGVLLTDAETGPDPSNPTVRGFWALENQITANGWGMVNATADDTAVRQGAPASATPGALGLENWWGCAAGPVVGAQSAGATATSCQGISGNDTAGAPSIERGVTRTTAPFLAPVPYPTKDAAPTVAFADPTTATVPAGSPVDPVVRATDDFGVRRVVVTVDGEPLGDTTAFPYAFEWTPAYSRIGTTVTFEAVVTDSAGQTTTKSVDVKVVAPAGYVPLTVTPAERAFGDVRVGTSADAPVTVTNTGETDVELDALTIDGAGYALVDPTCAADSTLAPDETCTATARFSPGAAGATSGTVSATYTAPGATGPATATLTGSGTVPPVVAPPVTDPPPTTPPVADPPPTTPPVTVPTPTPAKPVVVTSSLTTRLRTVSRARRITVGSLRCGTARTCRTVVAATTRIGGRTYRVTRTVTARTGRRTTIRLTLSRSAYAALRATTTRRARLKVTSRATDSSGGRRNRTTTLTIRA